MIRIRNLSYRCSIWFLVIICAIPEARSQDGFLPPSSQYDPGRLKAVVISEVAGGILISAGLYYLWYRKNPRSHFHFFNDNAEWLQMDKAGHATTAYNIGSIQYDLMRWCGVENGTAIAVGSATAIGYMTIIEIFDGFSSKWGFSPGDMIANIVGTAIFASQQRFWGEQRIAMKFSYHGTIYPTYYPQELGHNWISRIIKDYNGQTYWLSLNIGSFLPTHSDFPKWLNASVGYGAEGMIGARQNPLVMNDKSIPHFERYRQFYFAPDVDLLRIPSNSNFYNASAYFLQFLKFPAPTIEWNTLKKWKFYPIYF